MNCQPQMLPWLAAQWPHASARADVERMAPVRAAAKTNLSFMFCSFSSEMEILQTTSVAIID
ncbi:hypothetical protein CAP31_09130 [Sulfuriferula sp. AH1]|nr:hypothetical protein CAP31_09130 [Sulfuriferula sp. AH1]